MTYAVNTDVHAPASSTRARSPHSWRTAGARSTDCWSISHNPPTGPDPPGPDTKASHDHFYDNVTAPLATEAALTPSAGADTGGPAAQPPVLSMFVTQIDISRLVPPRGPIAF